MKRNKGVIAEMICDDIYEALKEIQKEEGVLLSSKAFIADFLSQKLCTWGYRPRRNKPNAK